MKVLVTGGGGFLGSGIVRALLARGDAVRIFARNAYPDLEALGADSVQGSVADAGAVNAASAGCEAVIHTAAIASSWGPRDLFYETNVQGTRNVIDACRTHAIPRLVFTSSPSVCFYGDDQEGVNETVGYPKRFLALYPETKAAAEKLVLDANSNELATVALRPHLIWGPGDTQLTPRLIERSRAGRLRIVGSGEQRIDATYIDNAVHAHVLALDRVSPGTECAGRAYYITNNEPWPVKKMINAILEAAGAPTVNRHVPESVAYAAGTVFEMLWRVLGRRDEPPMTRFVARQLATAHWYDISAAKRDLGFAPPVSMSEGLNRLGQHFGEAVA